MTKAIKKIVFDRSKATKGKNTHFDFSEDKKRKKRPFIHIMVHIKKGKKADG